MVDSVHLHLEPLNIFSGEFDEGPWEPWNTTAAGPLIVKTIIINSTDGLLIPAASNLYKHDQEDQGKGQRVQDEGVRLLIEE